jgi:hypothetical protein
MLKVTRETKNGQNRIILNGEIEEDTDLPSLIGAVGSSIEVACKDVREINSIGVKKWIEYFNSLQKKGVKFSFAQISPPLAEQLNSISNFSCGAPIISVLAEYLCKNCESDFRVVFKSEDLKKIGYRVPPVKCPACSSNAVFDDSPEEYFAFLIRLNKP